MGRRSRDRETSRVTEFRGNASEGFTGRFICLQLCLRSPKNRNDIFVRQAEKDPEFNLGGEKFGKLAALSVRDEKERTTKVDIKKQDKFTQVGS